MRFSTPGDIFDRVDHFFRGFLTDTVKFVVNTSAVDSGNLSCRGEVSWSDASSTSSAGAVSVQFDSQGDVWSLSQKLQADQTGLLTGQARMSASDPVGDHHMCAAVELAVNTLSSPTEDTLRASVAVDRRCAFASASYRTGFASRFSEVSGEAGFRITNSLTSLKLTRMDNGKGWEPTVGVGFSAGSLQIAGRAIAGLPRAEMVALRTLPDLETCMLLSLGSRDKVVIKVGFAHAFVILGQGLVCAAKLSLDKQVSMKLCVPLGPATIELGTEFQRGFVQPHYSVLVRIL